MTEYLELGTISVLVIFIADKSVIRISVYLLISAPLTTTNKHYTLTQIPYQYAHTNCYVDTILNFAGLRMLQL